MTPVIKNIILKTVFSLFFAQLAIVSFGQYGISYDIKKPKEFENRVLRSEKPQKKFSAPRRFIQNTVTHYNYFFNANRKLEQILQRAKEQFREDYSKLLPFYNYSLEHTMADSIELDSVAFKAQTGIVLHDLRNDWTDNMYLLWGASYYFQQQFDSAYLMFQFINYAYAKKEKDGYYLTIGSARDGNNANNISTKEKNSLMRKAFSEPPSRNEAFIWQIRNFLAQDKFSEASALILALRNDSQFPERLHNDLEEVHALYFYKQNIWDSTAAHLEKALSNAGTKQERARWEYLLAQLYEKTGQFERAGEFYDKAIARTTDPILEVYARLAQVRVNRDETENTIDNNIAKLIKMARRDKYIDYRDIIYYMAAQMELERGNWEAAIPLLRKSTQYTSNNPSQRNAAFLQLAELSFRQRYYRDAKNYYDSLNLSDPIITDQEVILERKSILARMDIEYHILDRQDSLMQLAALPEKDLRDYLRKQLRQKRREQGLKDEPAAITTGNVKNQETANSLFNDNQKGEWYFYNNNIRTKGLNDFKRRWGNRPNTDNWRRSAAQTRAANANQVVGPDITGQVNKEDLSTQLSYESLYEGIPLTEEKVKIVKDSVKNALFNLGQLLVREIDDCATGTDTLLSLQRQFPDFEKMDQLLFNLYYCFNKNGELTRAAGVKKIMAGQYSHSNLTAIVTTGKDPQGKSKIDEATRTYEGIYDQFIEGKFAEALQSKKRADSIYGSNYWTPQLLYIEAIYHIKQKDDNTAKTVLNNIITQFEGQPLAVKATTMLDVLNRRAEIEEELRNLVLVMPAEDSTRTVYTDPPVAKPVIDSAVVVADKPVVKQEEKTEPEPVKEPKLTKPSSSIAGNTGKPLRDTTINREAPGQVSKPVSLPKEASYHYVASDPQYVVLILNKVDPIFVSEARNAFMRFNRNEYYNKQMKAELLDIDEENKILLISPFANAEEAVAYVDKNKPRTSSEILPWLKDGKYNFVIISERNLELLKIKLNLEEYQKFLQQNLPGKF